MKNKKATSLAIQFLMVLAVTIIAALIYFGWLKDYRIFAEDVGDYIICRNSNIENAKFKLKMNNQIIQERKGNKCKTEYVDVPKGKELDFVAKKMAGCWDMYLEGREELFDTKDNNYCAICSVLTFKDKKELKGLTTYLIDKKAPNQGGKNYFDYFNRIIVRKEKLEEVKNSDLNNLHTIDAKNPLAVMFIMEKDVNPDSFTGESSIISAAGGASFGAVAGLLTLAGFGLCSTGAGCTLGAFLVAAGTGTTGYLIGSDYDPDRDSRILLWPYTNKELRELKCTILEGKDTLEIKKFQ